LMLRADPAEGKATLSRLVAWLIRSAVKR
jgi:hypothetical protein